MCLQRKKNVGCLPMAKPANAIINLEIRRNYASDIKLKLAVDSLQRRLLIFVSYDKNKLI